jgi:hypothetical protein
MNSASAAATRASSSVAGKRSPRRRDALAQAQAELALHRIHQEVPELHVEGLVQAERGAQLADLLRPGILPEQEDHRIAHVLEQQEGDVRDHHHDHHGLEHASQDESKHSSVGQGRSEGWRMLAEQAACRHAGFP